MTIPKNIIRKDVEKAFRHIGRFGIPKRRHARIYNVKYQKNSYPVKYTISIASKFRNGRELEPKEFISLEARKYLKKLGFNIS